MPRLAASSHADARLRILRVIRRGDRHDPRDLSIAVRFEGDFASAFLEGRTGGIVPPATLKSFVRETVRRHGSTDIETIGLALATRVLETTPQITRARVELAEHTWERLAPGGRTQGQSFLAGGPEQRSAIITSNGVQAVVVSGIQQLMLMRTSGFLGSGAPRRAEDGTEDAVAPLLVGTLSARWTYESPDVPFASYRQGIRAAILDTFAMHAAKSVQFTLYAIADVVLATYPDILDVTLVMQERPYEPADLFPPPIEGPDDLFVPADDPARTVEVTVERRQISA